MDGHEAHEVHEGVFGKWTTGRRVYVRCKPAEVSDEDKKYVSEVSAHTGKSHGTEKET